MMRPWMPAKADVYCCQVRLAELDTRDWTLWWMFVMLEAALRWRLVPIRLGAVLDGACLTDMDLHIAAYAK